MKGHSSIGSTRLRLEPGRKLTKGSQFAAAIFEGVVQRIDQERVCLLLCVGKLQDGAREEGALNACGQCARRGDPGWQIVIGRLKGRVLSGRRANVWCRG